jgi:hypothetical protein
MVCFSGGSSLNKDGSGMSMITEERLAEIMGELSHIEATSANKEAALDFLRPFYKADFRLAYEFSYRALRAKLPFDALSALYVYFPALASNSWYASLLTAAVSMSRAITTEMDEAIDAVVPIEWSMLLNEARIPEIDIHIDLSMQAGVWPDKRLLEEYARACPTSKVPERIRSLRPARFNIAPHITNTKRHVQLPGSPVFYEDPQSIYKPGTINPQFLDRTELQFAYYADAKLYMLPEMFGLLETAPAVFLGQSEVGAAFVGKGRLIEKYGNAYWKDESHVANRRCPIEIEGPILVPFRFAGTYYFHFVTETLQAIWAARDHLPEVTIALPASNQFYERISREVFHEAIEAVSFPGQKIIWLEEGTYLLKKAIVTAQYNYANLTFCSHLLEKTGINQNDEAKSILYIARRNRMGRSVANEDEITSMLLSRFDGVEIVYLEDLSFTEQIKMFRCAKAIIGPHGGGLTNIIFCRPGTFVLEFQLPNMATMYWHLCALYGLNYIAYVPKVVDLSLSSWASFQIDPAMLYGVLVQHISGD